MLRQSESAHKSPATQTIARLGPIARITPPQPQKFLGGEKSKTLAKMATDVVCVVVVCVVVVVVSDGGGGVCGGLCGVCVVVV